LDFIVQTRTETAQVQQQKIAVSLIRANALLQCTTAELMHVVELEQGTNPALEAIDAVGESVIDCGRCPVGGRPNCASCLYPDDLGNVRSVEREPAGDMAADRWSADWDDRLAAFDDDPVGVPQGDTGSDFDRLSYAPAPSTLAQEIRWQFGAAAGDPIDDRVSEYLIDSLDEQGYLRIDPREACALLGIASDELERAIRTLQSCDPPGIGARNLQECLRLQIEQWPETRDDSPDPLALPIVRDHWDLFSQGRFPQIARQMRTTVDRIDEAVAFIRKELTPYPAGQYREPWRHRPDGLSDAIRPDAIIMRTTHGFTVEVPAMDQLNLQVSPYFRTLVRRIRLEGRRSAPDARAAENEQVVECVSRAEALLANIKRRQWAIKKIAEAIAVHQQGFLETGRRAFLQPLTRTQIARELGLHESTVSRALLHKYVRLPSEEVVPFDCFFKGSSSERDVIAELIAREDRKRPLSDQDIADTLAGRGMPTARRTVAKYREELRLPPSHLRRVR
jgi:RNA polymerase sigma-54 factor